MLGSHCRAIRYERHDWPIVADRGTFVKFHVWIRCATSRYVPIRFVAIGCDLVTMCHVQVPQSLHRGLNRGLIVVNVSIEIVADRNRS